MRRLHRSVPASEPRRSRSNFPSSPHGISPGRVHGVVTVREGSVPVPLPCPTDVPGLTSGDVSGDGLPPSESVGLILPEGVGDASANVSFRSSSNAISDRPTVRCGAATSRSVATNATILSRRGSRRPRVRCASALSRHVARSRLSTPRRRSAPGVTRMMSSRVVPPVASVSSVPTARASGSEAKRRAWRRSPRRQWPNPGKRSVSSTAGSMGLWAASRGGRASLTPLSSLIHSHCGGGRGH